MALPLFDEPPAPAVVDPDRMTVGSPAYHGFWTGFAKGADGQSRPGAEPDERVTAATWEGWRIGRLFRPLPVTREGRR